LTHFLGQSRTIRQGGAQLCEVAVKGRESRRRQEQQREKSKQASAQSTERVARPSIKANSHRHARHDQTILSVSRPLQRCELDSRQLKTVADRKFVLSLNTFIAIVQFTLAHETRRRQDRLVVSGGRCELGISVQLERRRTTTQRLPRCRRHAAAPITVLTRCLPSNRRLSACRCLDICPLPRTSALRTPPPN